MINITPKNIEKKYTEIQELYLNDNKPWIIGFSGGKDSTTVLQLVYNAIKKLPLEKRRKNIYVVSSDTMLENPVILSYLKKNMDMISSAAKSDNLPLYTKLVSPEIGDAFWTLLLGKGYPTPRQKFRWCTNRLKIKPIDKFIDSITEKYDEVIVVLGVRREESQTRKESIEKRTVKGKLLKVHATNKKAYVYAPIEDFNLDEVWFYLLNNTNPWGMNNSELLSLYKSSKDASECPIQQDKDAPSCGNSRFGCWVCTVVKKDKSLTGFIENGFNELRPLLKFRNELAEMRDKIEYRQKWKIDGSIYHISKDGNKKRGLGPFTLEARKQILKMLLSAEVEYNKILQSGMKSDTIFSIQSDKYQTLIDDNELIKIREHWLQNGDWEDSLPNILKEYRNTNVFDNYEYNPMFDEEELEILESICDENDTEFELVKQLLNVEMNNLGLNRRLLLFNEIEKILKQDWIHEEILYPDEISEGEVGYEA